MYIELTFDNVNVFRWQIRPLAASFVNNDYDDSFDYHQRENAEGDKLMGAMTQPTTQKRMELCPESHRVACLRGLNSSD